MTGFNHVLAGTIIGLTIKQPLLIIPIAIMSHFVMDALPHFGKHPRFEPYSKSFVRYLYFDAVMCLFVLGSAVLLAPQYWLAILLGASFAFLPDFFWPLMQRAPSWLNGFYAFHSKIQWAEVPYGWVYEIGYFSSGYALMVAVAVAQL